MSDLNIPRHWTVASINELNTLQYGKNLPTSELTPNGYPVFGANGQIGFYKSYHYEHPEILITCRGATCGTINVSLPKSFITNNSIAIVPKKPDLYRRDFLRYALKMINPATVISGSAQPQITLANLEKINLPIPPEGEQKRIVQIIESCFQKLDKTEKALNEAEVLLTKYRESLLAKAFRGELITQDPKDEPASKLLKEIRAKRASKSNGKKDQEFAPVSEDEKPFDLPEGMEWISIGEAFYLGILEEHKDGNHGGSYPRSDEFISKGTPYITAKCIDKNECLDSSKYEYLSPERAKKLTIGHLKNGDILFAHNATVGPAVLYQEDFEDAVIGTSLTCYRPNPKFLSPYFLLFYLRSDLFQNQVKKVMKQATRNQVPILKQREFFIPFATLKCQDLIEQEIRNCLISFSQEVATVRKSLNAILLLRGSILSKAFQGALVPQVDSEGTGQELLEKILETKVQLRSESNMEVSKTLTKKTSPKKAKK